jgi:uncharacterized membrane protein
MRAHAISPAVVTPASRRARRACVVCGATGATLLPADVVPATVSDLISHDHAAWSAGAWICPDDLHRYRMAHVRRLVAEDRADLAEVEEDVLELIHRRGLVDEDPEAVFEQARTLGERAADRIAAFGGSWAFIGIFVGLLLAWVATNAVVLARHPFDPYPFILLNLLLSCVAALQAPVIMMSQNRQDARDRARSMNDYRVNLKAEVEVRLLHEKLDHLLVNQWERLLELQETIADLLDEVRERR